MSKEGKDSTYRPKSRTMKGPTRESKRIKSKDQVDYAEVDLISSDTESEGTIINSESGFGSVKLEPTLPELDLDSERFQDAWTPVLLDTRLLRSLISLPG